jgi:Ca-activated chloride channel family protein
MKKLVIFIALAPLVLSASAQSGPKDIREGNRYFKKDKFDEAETAYRQALGEQKLDRIASFNLGDALYRQKKFDEATHQFQAAASADIEKTNAAKAYHNLGNSLLQAGKIDESIEAYKDALRHNPSDLSTKYNLVYAQMLKKKQEQQKQQNQDNKNNQDKQQQDQQKQQQQDQQKQQQDQQKQQQNQQNQQQDQQNANQQQANAQPMKISKEDAKRLLEVLANNEKKVEEKVKKEKAKASKVRTIKDW